MRGPSVLSTGAESVWARQAFFERLTAAVKIALLKKFKIEGLLIDQCVPVSGNFMGCVSWREAQPVHQETGRILAE